MYDNMHTRVPHARVGRLATLLLVLLIGATGGCTSPATFQPASGGEDFPPYKGEVRVLENLPPSGQYKRVGVVMVEGVLLSKESDMVETLKKEAAAKGANAVVMQSPVKVSKEPDGSTTRRLAAWVILLSR
jgi:hypothetical protein